MTAHVKFHNGTPTLFLDGKPAFDGLMCGASPEPDKYVLDACTRLYGEAGIHLYAFGIGTLGTPPEWCGPGKGYNGHFDFSTLETRLKRVIQADEQARFHFRVHIEMQPWWQALYPEECELGSDGKRKAESYASVLWREQTRDFLRQLIHQIGEMGMAEHVIAYQPLAGSSGEWVKGETNMASVCADYSQPMRLHFRRWLREKYNNDEAALRSAWEQPNVSFDAAEVPPAERQLTCTHGVFRDPRREGWAVDYFRCLADLTSDLIIDYCATIKQAAGRTVLAGAFYGYLLELAWNAGFFGEGADSVYSTYQRCGHLGLKKVLDCPDVDFLVSPYSYGLRGLGGHGDSMLPTESSRLHGKIYIIEDDSRTHTSSETELHGKVYTVADSLTILRRNFAYAVTHGHGIWWGGGSGPEHPETDPSAEPAYLPMLRQFQEIGIFALGLERTPAAQVAVLLDDDSLFYDTPLNDVSLPLIFQQRLWGLPKMGAPYDVYLLQDLIDGLLPSYKLYILLNPFRLERARRAKLKGELQRDGRTALWIYAPGYIAEEPSLEAMADLTGFHFGKGEHPWGPLMHITDFEHPITRLLTQDLVWGTNNRLCPLFQLADPEARILGQVVYSQGACRPGLGVKQFAKWTSIYSAAPNLPAPVLRGIARFAGAHIFSDAADVLYATKQLLGVHTLSGGERLFNLPGRVEVVYDLFARRVIARDCDRFTVRLEPKSTALYYTGEATRFSP